MYKHKPIRFVFGLVLVFLLLLDWQYDLPWYSYFVWVLCYVLTVFLGSYFIGFNYFVNSYCRGNASKKEIAITFDDGPMADFTPQVLDVLKNENVPAAFFLIGKNIHGNETLLKRIINEGHVVGNHSFEHGFWFSMQRAVVMRSDLEQCENEIFKTTGLRPKLFRPPYGVTNPAVAEVVEQKKYHSIGWSNRTYDTVAKNPDKLLQKTLDNLKNGDVILFHDWGAHTLGILSDFIKQARLKGYNFVRADKLFAIEPYF
jgi:peptidoglycan/xylan/chitin deacetylase (PgdA/CDA1 family)